MLESVLNLCEVHDLSFLFYNKKAPSGDSKCCYCVLRSLKYYVKNELYVIGTIAEITISSECAAYGLISGKRV